MSDDLNVGIAGVVVPGTASELHGRALAEHPKLALRWICGRTKEDAGASANALGSDASTTNALGDLLADRALDAIVILSSASGPQDIAMNALQAGKSVLLETSAGVPSESFQSLEAVAATSSARLAVSCPLRFHPGHQAIKDRVRAGEFGPIRAIRLLANGLIPDGAEVLQQFGLPLIDVAIATAGLPTSAVENVASSIRVVNGTQAEVSASWSYQAGPFVQLFCSSQWESPAGVPNSRVEVHCKGAKIEFIDTVDGQSSGRVLIEGEEVPATSTSPFTAQLDDFTAALLADQQPTCDARVAVESASLLTQILSNAETVQ